MEDNDTQKPEKVKKYFKERDPLEYPIRREEGIEAGKLYRTRSGNRAQVYNITDRDIHGAILLNGVWEMFAWLKDGHAAAGKGKDTPHDIILSKPIVIKAGAAYQSRDGREIHVHEINKGSLEFPIVGTIRDENNYWQPRVWNEKGITKVPFGPNNDIVAEWKSSK